MSVIRNVHFTIPTIVCFFLFMACNDNSSTHLSAVNKIHLITLDPGHFHAALVQKYMYENVDTNVKVYAPSGEDVSLHLARIQQYNTRAENPTHWNELVYRGSDFFEKMLADNKTSDSPAVSKVVVLAGNNLKKTDYILESLKNGFNILGDKPMAIDSSGFAKLVESFDIASMNKLTLYDIMTERFEITSILLRELSSTPEIFGQLTQGSADEPAVEKHSVHYLFKHVSGNVLTRPPWFFDVAQEGEGITDIMTHLVDLVQWECFPGQALNYRSDVQVDAARRWPTNVSLSQFKEVTKNDSFPGYLQKQVVEDSILEYYCNGEIEYRLKGIQVKTSVVWNYKSTDSSGDSYEAVMRGSKSNLWIRQGKEQNFVSTLYIQPVDDSLTDRQLQESFKKVEASHPGISLQKVDKGWMVLIPDKYREGHEEHFARVTKNYLQYLADKTMPGWEVPGMIAKYYTTTQALQIANKK